ncbi:MAG: hypothetical protein AAFO04_16840 [Cyanobacteria bacterium J06592_8]
MLCDREVCKHQEVQVKLGGLSLIYKAFNGTRLYSFSQSVGVRSPIIL